MSLPVVAIVGRPNVGKSTLFNRILGRRKATVDDRPGVTRDRLYEEADLLGHAVMLIDTGGLEARPDTSLLTAIREQTLVAVEEADVILFLVDGKKGVTPADLEVADLIRRAHKPVVLAVNKVDGERVDELVADFWQLGFDGMLAVSAAHGRGIYELHEAIAALLPERHAEPPEEDAHEEPPSEDDDGELPDDDGQGAVSEIRIAVIGRPNIGKSTLVNKLLGAERHLVHDAPGTTTDPVDSALEVDGKRYLLVDTAGVRRRARIDDQLERFVSLRSIRAIERCHVCLLMIDATVGPTDQDARLAELAVDRGRALVVLLNKWDKVKDLEDVDSKSTEEALQRRLPHAVWAPFLFISAKTGKGLHRVLPTVDRVFAQFDTRIPTARINQFLERAIVAQSPPQVHNHPVRIYYMTQTRVRPPTFMAVSNTPDGIKAQYKRYLTNRLRDEFGFEGTPLRLTVKKRRKVGESGDG